MKISIISVLYNQELTSGNTWRTLLQPALCKVGTGSPEMEEQRGMPADGGSAETIGPEVHVILSDNSTDPAVRERNRRAAESAGAVYLDMEGNRGLPAACNRAIDRVWNHQEAHGISSKAGDEWVVVADQDTVFPENYLQVLAETALITDCDVLTPVVKAGKKQLSPCHRKGSRFVPCNVENSASDNESKAAGQVVYINSGLAFRSTIFGDPAVRYDEQLFLDFADFDLINRVRSLTQARFGKLPGIVLQQSFSGTETRTAEQDLERFRHFVHDGRLFYERWYGKGAAESAIRRRALRLAVKHRDTRFLKKN